jgi:hypothetical protein
VLLTLVAYMYKFSLILSNLPFGTECRLLLECRLIDNHAG